MLFSYTRKVLFAAHVYDVCILLIYGPMSEHTDTDNLQVLVKPTCKR